MNTYQNLRIIIERGNYNKDDMLSKLDIFFIGDRLTKEQYEELARMVKAA